MIGTPIEITQWLFNQDRDKNFTIKEYKQKRSLNANNYAWKLMGEIAKITSTTPDEVYEVMLKDYGTNIIVNDEIVKISSQTELHSSSGLHLAFIGKTELDGKVFNHYRLIKGSSEYDSKEMSQFIDGVVREAQDLGINTMTPNEISLMKEAWANGNKQDKKE